jgi:transposase
MRGAAFFGMRTVGTPEELERRRHLAVQRVLDGYTADEVADFLAVHRSSVYHWLAAFRCRGDAGLAARPAPGRPRKLSHTHEKIVFRWLAELPTQHGFPTDLWTADRLAQLIERDLGVSLDAHYLCAWLRRHDYTPQKPRRVPRERDERAIDLWLAKDWPRIKRLARQRGACLMLLDESGLLLAPLLRRSWAPRGRPPESKEKTNHREKVSVAAGLWLTPLRDELGLAYQTLINGFFDNEAVGEFLQRVMQQLRKPLTVIWDRGPMHKGDPIEDLLDRWGGRLDVEPLPSHSPRLMPVEFLWRCLKHGRLCNFPPRDALHLHEAVVRELNLIAKDQILLRSFFHLSDLPLPVALLS